MSIALMVPTALAGVTLEAVIDTARRDSPTVQMSADDLTIADHTVGMVTSTLLPRISASSRDTYRYSNPEKYTFDYSYDGSECVPTEEDPCIPFVVIEGQVVIPNESWSRSRSLSGSQTLSVDPVMDLLEQRQRRVSTTIQVRSEEESLIFELIGAYTDLQYQRGQEALYTENILLAEEMEAAVTGQHAAGEATDLDLDAARLDTASARLDLLQLNRTIPLSLADMAHTAGIDTLASLSVCDFGEPLDDGSAIDLTNAVTLARLESTLAQESLGRKAGRLDLVPDLSLNGGLTWAGSGELYGELTDATTFDNWYVGASLSTTLFDGGASYHQRRSDAASLHRAQLDLARGQEALKLDDAQLAQALTELQEEAVLLDASVVLAERNVVATRSRYLDGGQVPLDAYTQARASLEQLQLQRLALAAERQELTALRWINAGLTEDLLEALFAADRRSAASDRCHPLSRQD